MTRGQGTLYRQRNSRFWWFRIGFQGRILCASTKTTDKREAREILKQKSRELEAAKGGFVTMPGPEAKRVTVGELLDELLAEYELHSRRSIKGVRSHLKRVREELGEMRVVDLKPKDLTAYQAARHQAEAAGGTINRELALLRRAVRRFLEDQKLPTPRVAMLAESVREGFFTQAEVAKLVKHLPKDLHDFVWFGFYTGWRKGEIASLKWADVDEEAGTLRLSWRKSKNNQARTMALEGALSAIIKGASIARAERVLKGHDSPFVFVRGDGTKAHGRPVDDFGVVWRRACKEAGLEGRLFHDLRRSAARTMDRAGVSRHVAMQITGHKTEAMYRRYNIVSESDIRAAMVKTQAYLAKTS
jgi:integrase